MLSQLALPQLHLVKKLCPYYRGRRLEEETCQGSKSCVYLYSNNIGSHFEIRTEAEFGTRVRLSPLLAFAVLRKLDTFCMRGVFDVLLSSPYTAVNYLYAC